MEKISVHDIKGFKFGHAQNLKAATGCTVIICEEGAACGMDSRGGSPVTRDTLALGQLFNRKLTYAVTLAGGSSFGLEASGGVASFLEKRGVGRDVGVTRVPNVCGAILFDLKCGRADVRPDFAMGWAAAENSYSGEKLKSGNFGAGTGATVGKALGGRFAMKGGVGSAAYRVGELMAGAVVAVNCVGDIIENGKIIAGARGDGGFADSEKVLLREYDLHLDFGQSKTPDDNTVIGCVVTNARMDKAGAARVAAHGQNGVTLAVRPPHLLFDGDTMFAMSFGEVKATLDSACILAGIAVRDAIIDAVKSAKSAYGYLGTSF
ncbi:MAG: P1 family peptidase [Clostridiales bacterium]|jgi:L-aminopeptidase/D-esterase-like protein|nr:P1 family peptidase [Clostridiales bacterium]